MPRWRVLLTEDIHPDGRRLLEEHAQTWVAAATDEQTLLREVATVDGLVLRARGSINRRVMDAAPRLRVIGRHGVGLDNVDIQAATARGIQVVYTPDANQDSVAEHTIACLLALAKRLPMVDAAVRAGDWEIRNRHLATEVAGRTLGIVGMGRIGRKVGRVAYALGMRLAYADPVPCAEVEAACAAARRPLDDLLASSDVVSLHVPLHDDTRALIGARELARMRRGAWLINTARGELVDEDALAEALASGHLGAAAIDVFRDEPPRADHPLLRSPRVLLTPHSAAMTDAAARRMSLVVEDVLAVLEGRRPRYPANECRQPESQPMEVS